MGDAGVKSFSVIYGGTASFTLTATSNSVTKISSSISVTAASQKVSITPLTAALTESIRNPGTFEEVILLKANAGTLVTNPSTAVSVTGLPSGLSSRISRLSDRVFSVNLIGESVSHSSASSTSAQITTSASAFVGTASMTSSPISVSL